MSKYDVDQINVAGKLSPGACEITRGFAPNKWDERLGYGLSGSTIVFRGAGLITFTVKIRMWTDAQLEEWETWKEVVARPMSKRYPKALKVWHPILEDLGVSAAVVEKRGQLTKKDTGDWEVEIYFKEFRRPKLALASPNGVKDEKPIDPYDQKIAALSSQVSELMKP
jgi:hypothetical protein